jgi:hypothetical protein
MKELTGVVRLVGLSRIDRGNLKFLASMASSFRLVLR